MFDLFNPFKGVPPPLLGTGLVLIILIAAFLIRFLVPGLFHFRRLGAIQQALKGLSSNNTGELKRVFAADARLAHLWKEYQETTHAQKEDRDGLSVVIAVRSTVPAETYFNSQYVVDSRLHTEFFKHFPGIFTGVGIIGTFTGLIEGLRQFQVSENAERVRTSLELLLHGVYEAFLVSASAIAAAMIVTFLEKLLLSSLYGKTEWIAHDIDARFNAGAGEEYLSRLVNASEDSASQSKILKDALVSELGTLLRELTEAQIEAAKSSDLQLSARLEAQSRSQIDAARSGAQELASAISTSIKDSLDQPLRDIADSVKAASGDQSAMASRMLQDVLASFSEELRRLFGGQISGINELNQETARTMQSAVQALNSLVANMEKANQASGEMMAERMAQALEMMERRQENINHQSAAFVEQLKQMIANSQTETNDKMQGILMSLGHQVEGMVDALRIANEQGQASSHDRERQMTQSTTSAVTRIADTVGNVIDELTAISVRTHSSMSTIEQVTTRALENMNTGADALNAAAFNFAKSGDQVSGVMVQAATLASELNGLTGTMSSSSSVLREVLDGYRAQRDAVTAMVIELRAIVESAKREVTMTEHVLARIQGATDKLAAAQGQADRYLEGVSTVLAEAHQSFANATIKTLDRANQDFHSKLSSAVALLSASIQELDATIGGA